MYPSPRKRRFPSTSTKTPGTTHTQSHPHVKDLVHVLEARCPAGRREEVAQADDVAVARQVPQDRHLAQRAPRVEGVLEDRAHLHAGGAVQVTAGRHAGGGLCGCVRRQEGRAEAALEPPARRRRLLLYCVPS